MPEDKLRGGSLTEWRELFAQVMALISRQVAHMSREELRKCYEQFAGKPWVWHRPERRNASGVNVRKGR